MVVLPKNAPKVPDLPSGIGSFRFLYFSQLHRRPVCAGKIKDRIGKVADLVFRLTEPYPEAAGIYIEHGWGKPTQFVPWDRVLKIEDDAIFVKPAEGGGPYPPRTIVEVTRLNQDDIFEVEGTFFAPQKTPSSNK